MQLKASSTRYWLLNCRKFLSVKDTKGCGVISAVLFILAYIFSNGFLFFAAAFMLASIFIAISLIRSILTIYRDVRFDKVDPEAYFSIFNDRIFITRFRLAPELSNYINYLMLSSIADLVIDDKDVYERASRGCIDRFTTKTSYPKLIGMCLIFAINFFAIGIAAKYLILRYPYGMLYFQAEDTDIETDTE